MIQYLLLDSISDTTIVQLNIGVDSGVANNTNIGVNEHQPKNNTQQYGS